MSQNLPSTNTGSRDNDPFTSLRRGMDRLFDQVMSNWGSMPAPFSGAAFSGPGVINPRVDISENKDGFEITAELPGIDPKDVAVEVNDGVLSLRAERKVERKEEDKDKRWHLVERQAGTYLRRFALPFDPDPDKVQAHFDKGVLHVTIPRPAETKPATKRIEVKG